MTSMIKNFFVFAGLILLAVVGYYLFVVERDATIMVHDNVAVSAEAQTQLFLRRLEELETVELSSELFSDPRFMSLVNFETPVTVVPVGRPLPFAPYGYDGFSVTTELSQ